ncbi:hypothetical protein [Microbacterium sp. SLBN-146]|uniref:hypothetical protein n=1 Tax=Microbacterium sp. SLBN-146 TaxID=2768457 RepID=UPI001151D4FF|nr:hypothetical protein [Microbacterium sp. SLBN-146]
MEFRSEDGRIVCGIITVGHFTTTPGTASCTVDTFADILPQPYPDTGPYVQSVMVTPYMGASHLYPNWFGYPERSIPVVPAGMSIRYEGTRCTVSNDDVTCRVTATGEGFTLSPGGFTFH